MRILLVEDEFLVAITIEEMLRELGCDVIGPVADLNEAMAAAQRDRFDAALLDINLDGRRAYAIAELLRERNIPFAFTTGYSGSDLPAKYRGDPRLQKPISLDALRRTLTALRRRPG